MKILIWDDFPYENTGGPAGYCYNIHKYIENHQTNQIDFLTDLIEGETGKKCNLNYPIIPNYVEYPPSKLRSLIQRIPVYLKFWYPFTSLFRKFKKFRWDIKVIIDDFYTNFHIGFRDIPTTIDVAKYDFIHFHMVQTLMQFKNSYPEYRGKTILTSHCPCPWTDERISVHKPISKKFRWLGILSECKSFSTADYIMFPCLEAREPYEKDKKIRQTFKKNEKKFFYVPTAILDTTVTLNNIQRISSFGIPTDAFVITYFGRHISIKGYDILKDAGSQLLEKHKNLYILCAGTGNIKPLNHPRWIELGYIKNAEELHSQSDLYILANRETYFDIGTLEVLRAGVHIIMSNTGGNKFFKHLPKEETVGIKYFEIDDVNTLVSCVETSVKSKEDSSNKYVNEGKCNRILFQKYFTPDKYINSYLKIVNSLE